MSMTWKEFKDKIDKRLQDDGKSDTIEIFFIDTGNHPKDICIWTSEDGLEVYR